MNVVLTREAIADLRDIGLWIALDDPDRAATFVRELSEKCLELADRPLLHPAAEEIGLGVRKRRHRNYLILYRIQRSRIEILHVIHGSRDQRALFTSL